MNKLNSLFFFLILATACAPKIDAAGSSERAVGKAQVILEQAIVAHGGLQQLQTASTWKAQIRRFQRGSSYVMTNYYRPGMVRLEQDRGDGSRSADVIGDPHCWGMAGVVSVICSAETRENDRPRVIMEMAVQLWPLLETSWELRSASQHEQGGNVFDVIEAFYGPRESLATLSFDSKTHLLHSISIPGIKGGDSGTHLHVYSDYVEHCGVQMPAHNVKSFDGEIWVSEDVLELNCVPVNESMFIRPAQVEDGFITAINMDETVAVCDGISEPAAATQEARQELQARIADSGLAGTGGPSVYLRKDGSAQLCLPVKSVATLSDSGLSIRKYSGGRGRSIFAVDGLGERTGELLQNLFSSVKDDGDEPVWPVRITTYDNDGMGLTGEIVVELSVLAVNER